MSAGSVQPAAVAANPAFALTGGIPPRRIPLTYRVTLALTALAMVLLPLIYIALIVVAGWGVRWYAHYGLAIFGTGIGIWRLVLYVAPLFAGAALIGFMIKPLFARPAQHADPLVIDLEEHPSLRALIAAICAEVRAPMPTEVRVDCQVNASASLRRGLWSLGRGDLALTIGLPLVTNLTARQLAGVLAHEFGHFAQGAGMAFTYIIRSVNAWFARVVFERDSWDEQLAEWSENTDGRIALVLFCARVAIWISRRILHGLMMVGHAIACLQLRQMEFDADYYETHVAGSDAYVETSRELRRLGLVAQTAFGELGSLWNERRLVDDFPGLISRRRAQLSTEDAAKIDGQHFSTKTQWFDTHPSDLDRSVRAKALKLPGLYRNDEPAAALFTDFATVSRIATEHFYREQLELHFEPGALVPVSAAARRGDEAAAAQAALRRLTSDLLHLARPLTWQQTDFAPSAGIAAGSEAGHAARLAALRQEIAAHRDSADAINKAFKMLLEDRTKVDVALAFSGVSVEIKPEVFQQLTMDPAKLKERRDDLTRRLADKQRELLPFESAISRWVGAVVAIARDPARDHRIPAELAARIDASADALVRFAPWFDGFPAWMRTQAVLAALAANTQPFDGNTAFSTILNQHREHARSIVNGMAGLVEGAMWPAGSADRPVTVEALLQQRLDGVFGDGRIVAVLQTVAWLHSHLLGQLAAQGEELERALAVPA